jgi:hypothetical protein
MTDLMSQARLADDLTRVVTSRLLDPLELILGDVELADVLRDRVSHQVRRWAAEMLGNDEQAAGRAAFRLIAALYPSDEVFQPPVEWWRTPFGQIVARRVGVPGVECVSVAVAAAMLGISRQFVHDLMKRGKLVQCPDGSVGAASIRARINARGAE